LVEDAVPRINEEDGDVRGRGAGGHVARVLLVARCVGENELAPRRREVAVGDVNGDALLAFGAQAVGEERKVDGAGRPVLRRLFDRQQLIFVHRLRVVQQPSNQRALAIVDAAGRTDTEEGGTGDRHQKYPSRFLISIDPSWS
jgi:hypothetical protein